MKAFAYILAPLLLAGCCCLGSAVWGPRPPQHPPDRSPLLAPASRPDSLSRDHRQIRTSDGIGIDAWFFRAAAPIVRGTVICLHGMIETKAFYLWLPERLVPAGYDVVLMDLRAHGASGGARSTFGAREKHDVKAVVDAALANGLHAPIYAWGISMGAATAIQYAAIDPRCRGVVAVTPYRDFPSVAGRLLPGVGQLMPFLGDFKPEDTSTLLAVRTLSAPLIVVHGRDDTVIPWTHGRDICQAAPGPKRLVVVPNAGHANILSGRDDWFVQQIRSLPTLAAPTTAPGL